MKFSEELLVTTFVQLATLCDQKTDNDKVSQIKKKKENDDTKK